VLGQLMEGKVGGGSIKKGRNLDLIVGVPVYKENRQNEFWEGKGGEINRGVGVC